MVHLTPAIFLAVRSPRTRTPLGHVLDSAFADFPVNIVYAAGSTALTRPKLRIVSNPGAFASAREVANTFRFSLCFRVVQQIPAPVARLHSHLP